MKRYLIKIALLTAILAIALIFVASCELLLPGMGCSHYDVDYGNCLERAKCNICGRTVGDLGDHDYLSTSSAPTCTSDGSEIRTCKYCGDSETVITAPALGHSFDEWIITVHPGVSETGEMQRACTRCGFIETDIIEAHEHDIVNAEAKDADCESDGWYAYEYCTLCEYNTRELIAAIGHAWGPYTYNGNGTHSMICGNDPSHVVTDPCSGGVGTADTLPICSLCGSEYEFAPRPGNSTYGYYALGEYDNGDKMQRLYRDLSYAAESFFYSDEDVIPDSEHYVIDSFDASEYSLSLDSALAVWKIFYISNPAYYWLDSAVISIGDAVLLTIAPDYANAEYRRSCDAEIAEITSECSQLIDDGMSDLERAVKIVAYIVENMEYAYESDGVTPVSAMWAHNMAGFAVYNRGVCEAYAKTFMYLCLLNGVDCAMGSGFAGDEAHAWNYVKIDDEWYGVDVTWTDNSGDTAVYDSFGISAGAFFADHTPHPSIPLGIDFVYEAPELSDSNIELTSLYMNGEYMGMYKSIDDAFSAMTDTTAEYLIDVTFYSSYEHAATHSINATNTPAAKKLTILGKSEFVGESYLDNNTPIYIMGDITLGSDLELGNVHLKLADESQISTIYLVKHALILGGESTYLDCRVWSNHIYSSVIAETERGAYIFGGVDIYRLFVKSDKIVFGADSVIEYSETKGIYTTGNAEVEIKHYV